MNDLEKRVGQQIEQEKANDSSLQDMLDVFSKTSKGNFLAGDSEEFIKNICVDESHVIAITAKYAPTRRSVYGHYIRNAFHYLDDDRGQLYYIGYLKFKKAFGELDIRQATLFTNRLIELYNAGFEFQDYAGEFKPPYQEGRNFQIMCYEIEKIVAATSVSSGKVIRQDMNLFMQTISVDEKDLIVIENPDGVLTRKSLCLHFMRNAFSSENSIYFDRYLTFKKSFSELDTHQATLFVNRLIALHNAGTSFDLYDKDSVNPYAEARGFKILCHEIEEVKKEN